MYICGSETLARRLIGLTHGGAPGDGPATEAPRFSLPGDVARYAPDRPADVRHVDMDIRLDFDQQMVHGDVTTHFTTLFQDVREVLLHADGLEISQVTLAENDTPLSVWMEGDRLHIALDRVYHHGEEFAVRIRYSTHPRSGLIFVTPEPGNPELPVQVWTQGETEYHHYWLPCHDFPNDRATTSLRATVPGSFFVLSNGRLMGVDDHSDGTRTYTWRMDEPYPAYLITLVAGEFAELKNSWQGRPVNSYVPHGREDDGHRMFDKTPAMMEFFSERFGVEYPFVKYGQIVAEKFTGAMENASATTHTYRLLADKRASIDFTPEPVVAHELVHQWHGDMIAVRDWSQTWLKESFADYFEACWRQHDRGEDEFRTELQEYRDNYLAADKQGRRPIVYNVYRKNGNELFDRHVYDKGAAVLHMMRYVLGEEPFWRAIQHYTQRNQWREVITADLERAVEEATGRSMARFFEQWLYKSGHPEFTVRYSWDDEHSMARLSVSQTQQVTDVTPLFVTPVEIGFMVPEAADGAHDENALAQLVTYRVQIEQAEHTFYFPLARRPRSVRFDQGGWLIKTLDFERPGDLLRYQLRHDPDVLGRIEAAQALGKLGDRASIEALAERLVADEFWSVRAAIAEALAAQRNERALDALLIGLEQVREPKARRAIVVALGTFRAPEQEALAQRAAQALTPLVEHGEPSLFVEAAAAMALGKTRTPGAFEKLLPVLGRPSWNETVRTGAFMGLGELGEPRVVDVLTSWLDLSKPQDARMGAAIGLRVLANTHRVEGEARTRAVDALMIALGDPWELTAFAAIEALAAWGEQRAIPALRRVVDRSPDERLVRRARIAIRTLQQGRTASEETRQLRSDLEELRQQNRQLRDRLDALEAQRPRADGDGKNGKEPKASKDKAKAAHKA